jgi:predicted KAP-like P-loop ATPase
MSTSHFHDDRPILEPSEDRLGYAQPAKHIAEAILKFSSPEGFVFGLEGEWGSGKTSFMNLIVEALRASSQPPEVIKFSPWLISTRSALLDELFQSLAAAALKIPLIEIPAEFSVPNLKARLFSKVQFKRNASKSALSKTINAFGGHISRLGKYAGVAEILGIPYAGFAGKTFQAGAEAVSSNTVPTLDQEKENLQSELRKLSRKIVVFIDDLDRLEPNEALEIVRLVRAVVDFPNIVYVLCYSRSILVQSLGQALSLPEGEKYLDKIVQVTFSVPRPEDFDLRRMFKQKIEDIFPEHLQSYNDINPNYMLQRLNEVIDREGGRTLLTPRDINRALNSLQLYAAPIIHKIDMADMTWLQLIRIRNNKLYEWIEEYMNTASVLVYGATLGEHGKQKMLDDLLSILAKERADTESVMHSFADMLPGIEDKYLEKGGNSRWTLFHELTRNNVAKFIQDSRLGSPQHFRYYFALAKPSMALEDSDFQKFIENAERNVNDAIQYFLSLSCAKRPQGGVWSEAIIDRLVNEGIQRVPEKSIPGIIVSFAFAMDRIALHTGVGDWGEYWTWKTAKTIMHSGLLRLSPSQRSETVYSAFSDGEALGWLTLLLRDETFAHGLAGDQQKDEADRLLTRDDFDRIAVTMRQRYKQSSPEMLMKTPKFTNVLFGWMQLGNEGEEEVKDWVQSLFSTDDSFITLMENMRSWGSVNGKIIYPLHARNLEYFCDITEVDNRLGQIAQRNDDPLSARAKLLVQARELSK